MINLKNKNRRKNYNRQLTRKRQIQKYCSFLQSECPMCGRDTLFYHKYDSIICLYCDVWFSKACTDKNCPFCADRPETPSSALRSETEENTDDFVDRKEILMLKFSRRHGGKIKKERKLENYISWEESKWQRK